MAEVCESSSFTPPSHRASIFFLLFLCFLVLPTTTTTLRERPRDRETERERVVHTIYTQSSIVSNISDFLHVFILLQDNGAED